MQPNYYKETLTETVGQLIALRGQVFDLFLMLPSQGS